MRYDAGYFCRMILAALILTAFGAHAQTRRISPSGGGGTSSGTLKPLQQRRAPAKAPVEREKLKIKADSMVYRNDTVIEAKGNVVVIMGDRELSADYVIVNTATEEADAYGNVVIKEGTNVTRVERLHYDFKMGVGDADALTYNAAPFKLKTAKVERMDGNRFLAKGARVTTCEHGFDHPHFMVRASEIVLQPDESIRGKHSVFYFGPVPIFYLPYWYRDLNESTGWRFRAGYESKWGGYLLSSYRYPLGEIMRGETHLDYRSDRGFALGQDFDWIGERSSGAIELYYVNDDEPLDKDDDPGKDVDSTRYRIKVKDTSTLTERDVVFLQGEYVSDIDFREDFYEREYRDSVQPDNFIVYAHRGDRYTADLVARTRLNDFYEGVNRLPEASLSVLRQPLGESLLYYESQTYFSNLERVFPVDGSDQEDYSSMRIDTAHLINYPGRYFGFLTVIPRLGIRGTYFGATRETELSSQVVSVASTNSSGVVTSSLQTNEVTTVRDGAAEFRSRFELGCEASFKAYRTWGGVVAPRRHVVEPYVNYTLVPEPSVLPEDLYQFDYVDTLDKEHWIQLGVRNKYQKKVNDEAFDIIDFNLYTILLLDRDEGQDLLANFYFDGRLQPGLASLITFDGYYDTASSELARFNARIEYNTADWWQIGGEYHYTVDSSSLISADITFLPNHSWTWNLFGRYEAETGRMEEEGGYIQRNLDCMSVRTRLSVLPAYTRADDSEVDAEWRVMFEFWLTAFPDVRVSARHGG